MASQISRPGRRRRGEARTDDERCTRSDGRDWRCCNPRFPASQRGLCERHHLLYLATLKMRRVSTPSSPSPSDKNEPVPAPGRPRHRSKASPGAPKPGQVWALPHAFDGFPRAYARVERLIPREAKAKITPLHPHPSSKEEGRWAEQGVPVACGVFQARGSTASVDISAFSHLVDCQGAGSSSLYRIFPQKGEVWAVYHGWDGAQRRFVYKLVEIVSDFDEKRGVSAVALGCVEGTEDVLERHLHEGFEMVRAFSRAELLRFSHHVPALKLEGDGLWKILCP